MQVTTLKSLKGDLNMENKKLRVGIVGCGGMGRGVHSPAFSKMEDVEIAAYCDIIRERAEELAEKYGVAPECVYTDYKEMLKQTDLDAIDIITPNKFHSEIAVAAMEAGFHVFCEKPDAVSIAEAAKMKDASERTGKILMVMRNNRYRETAKYLKQFIGEGRMGEVYAARCGWQRRRGAPGVGGWFTTKALSGGGPLIDLGVHMIDLTMWLMGNPRPVAVSGCTYCKFAESSVSDSTEAKFGDKKAGGTFDVEDLAMGFIRFDNGACLQVEVSWNSNVGQERQFVELRGDKAGSIWNTDDGKLRIFTEEFGNTVDITPNAKDMDGGHAQNLRHFVDCVLYGAEPMFVPQQGYNMVGILEAMYRSAKEGHEIQL